MEINKKKKFISDSKIELITAIFLGLTALLMAWATWIGSLHDGNQATNYTKSNNLASEGNSEYNAAMQIYLSDVLAWNTIFDYLCDVEIAKREGNNEKAKILEEKAKVYVKQNCSAYLRDAIEKTDADTSLESPFEVEGFTDGYLSDAKKLLEESQALLEQGKQDNTNGDTYNLVTVIYSLMLFLLGIVGIFKTIPNRIFILGTAVAGTVLATIYMLTIPLPTGFNLLSFFLK